MDIEPGRAKRARRAYTFDDIAVVPSRRTRNPEDVSTTWTIDAFSFDIPVLGAPMDSVVSPQTAIMLGQLGGLTQPQHLEVGDHRPALLDRQLVRIGGHQPEAERDHLEHVPRGQLFGSLRLWSSSWPTFIEIGSSSRPERVGRGSPSKV